MMSNLILHTVCKNMKKNWNDKEKREKLAFRPEFNHPNGPNGLAGFPLLSANKHIIPTFFMHTNACRRENS